jgi:biopolymer transport protein ExbD
MSARHVPQFACEVTAMAFSISNSAQQSEINVTPLIDVLLVLLIIFMVIVPVTPRGLDSRVPQVSKASPPVLGPVSLRVLGGDAGPTGGKITYEVEGHVVDRAQLSEALLASLRVRAERSVYVSASPQVSYREIAAAVGAAKVAGAATIGLGRL